MPPPPAINFPKPNIFDVLGNPQEYWGVFVQKWDAFFGSTEVLYAEFVLIGLSLLMIVAIVIVLLRIVEVWKRLHHQFYPSHSHISAHAKEAMRSESPVRHGAMREAWETVSRHMTSTNPSDWKLAVLEADAILDELTESLGYPGESLGERLKMVTESEMKTLQFAWEAHKVRNRIAHEWGKANLVRDDAVRVLGMYERVFREFDYI